MFAFLPRLGIQMLLFAVSTFYHTVNDISWGTLFYLHELEIVIRSSILVVCLIIIAGQVSYAQEYLKIDDLRSLFNERRAGLDIEGSSVHLRFSLHQEYLPGKLELLEWKLKCRKIWYKRGWRTESELVEDFTSVQHQQFESLNKSLEKEIEFLKKPQAKTQYVFDVFFERDRIQTRWVEADFPRQGDFEDVLPNVSPTRENLLTEYSNIPFFSAVEIPNRVISWSDGVPVLAVLPLEQVPKPMAGILPPIPTKLTDAIPVNDFGAIDEFFLFDQDKFNVRISENNTAIAEALRPQGAEKVYEAVRGVFDLKSGWPTELHFFTFEHFGKSPATIPKNANAHRSFNFKLKEFPEFGIYPSAIRLIYRNGANRLFQKGEQISEARSDGMSGYFEELMYEVDIETVERVGELKRDFFDLDTESPLKGISISNALIGAVTKPSDFSDSIDKSLSEINGASYNPNSSNLYLIWASTLAVLAIAIYMGRQWKWKKS